MENISLESLDLKNNKAHCKDQPDFSAKMSSYEKRRYHNKLLFVWGIPIACGIFSFIYWFVFVPLLWSALPHQQWPLLWFSLYGLVAFAVWLAIMALCLLWWRHKHDTIVKGSSDDKPYLKDCNSKGSSNDSGFKDSPPFPTKVSAVQPLTDTPSSSVKDHRGSSVCVPVQSDNTPSLYNSRTGRESFEAGYQLDSEPTSSSVSVQSVIPKHQETPKQNSGVLLLKKMDSLKQEGSKKKRISSSGSEGSSSGFKNVSRDSGDGLENCVAEDRTISQDTDTENFQMSDLPPPLTREESFKGLPEMNSFGKYLQLVTIETPMSPREIFFSDLTVNKTPDVQEVQMRAPRDRKSYCIGDLSAAQQRITEARKSMPLFMYSSDIESGLTELPPPVTTPPPPTVLEIVDESPKTSPSVKEHPAQEVNLEVKYDEAKSREEELVSQVKASVTSAGSKSSGKYFIADVLRTESITSELHLNIEGESPTAFSMMKWETKVSGSPIPEQDIEGKWIVLSREYAANNLEAFIRLEGEAMARERAEGIFPQYDDTDNDSVFLEPDH